MIAYHAMLDVPRHLVGHVSKLLHAERRARGTRKGTRAPACWRQALFVLVWFRKREDLGLLGAGFEISRATAYRYRDEALRALAAQAPDLHEALERVEREGWSHVICDGTVVGAARCGAKTAAEGERHRRLVCGEGAHTHGGNIQAVLRPDGFPVWVFDVEPGSTHDLAAARIQGIPQEPDKAWLITLADKGYHGAADHVLTPYRGTNELESAEGGQPWPRSAAWARRVPQRPAQPGTSCGNYAAARTAPSSWPRPSTS